MANESAFLGWSQSRFLIVVEFSYCGNRKGFAKGGEDSGQKGQQRSMQMADRGAA